MPTPAFSLCSLAAVAALIGAAAGVCPAAPGEAIPAWLKLRPGTLARVDIAPWDDADEPEATLTSSAASLTQNFSDDATRPDDILYQPVGVRVRVVRAASDGRTILVHGIERRFEGFTLPARLVPEVPPGTVLVVAGGFGGFADFYPRLDTPEHEAERVATGSPLAVSGTDVAPYDPDSADLVRVRVRVLGGAMRGRTGWIAVAYTGLPETRVPASADVAEKACMCRLVRFGGS
jgi:hypothetical protein